MSINFTFAPQGKTLYEYYHDRNEVCLIRGPFGSGKTTQAFQKLFRHMQLQPPNASGVRPVRYACIRNTYSVLMTTSVKDWLDMFGELGQYRSGGKEPPNHRFKVALEDGTTLQAELYFIAADRNEHIEKFKGTQFTGLVVNETNLLPKPIFDVLTARHGRYPNVLLGGVECGWHGLIGDYNSHDEDHWLYELATNPPEGWSFYHQPGGVIWDGDKWVVNEDAENAANLPKDYYLNSMRGKSDDWIKVFLANEYGFAVDGKPIYPEFSESLHVSKMADYIPGLRVYRGWDFGLCYDDQTEVLTESGWRHFKDLNKLDKVATRNPATNGIEYHVPAFGVDRWYEGDMLEWASSEVNFCVTPEHLIPCRDDHKPNELQFKSAEWLEQHNNGHWRVDVTSEWEPKGWVDPNYYGMSAGAFAAFMGLYLSEGSVCKHGNSHRIVIYQNNKRAEMDEALKDTGMAWMWFGAGWRCTRNDLGSWLHSLGTAHHKRVPREIAMFPGEYIRRFIEFYTMGDGHVRIRDNGAEEHTLFTMSDRMAADMQELAQKVGWTSSVRVQKGRISTIVEGSAVRKIQSNDGFVVTFKKSSKTAGLHAKHFQRKHYAGRIYCVNVPYHTLYVRRGGRAHWNGNTPACVFAQIRTNGQFVVFHEVTSERSSIDALSDSVLLDSVEYGFKDVKDYGDPSGEAGNPALEEASCFDVLHGKRIQIEGSDQSPTIRKESLRHTMTRLSDGKPMLMVHPRAKMVIKGLRGGYCLRRLRISGERFSDFPDKNEYSHPVEALEYTAARLFGDRVRSRDDKDKKHEPIRRRQSIA